MEGLNSMLKMASVNGWIRGFQVNSRNEGMEVSHLFYADDTLIFCDDKLEQLRVIRLILTVFEAISGLHINWGKVYYFMSIW